MLFILRSAVYLYTGPRPISGDYIQTFLFYIGNGKFMGVLPYAAIIAIIILVTFIYIMNNTSYELYAIGECSC